jgi:hypothetical protein
MTDSTGTEPLSDGRPGSSAHASPKLPSRSQERKIAPEARPNDKTGADKVTTFALSSVGIDSPLSCSAAGSAPTHDGGIARLAQEGVPDSK